MAAREHQSESVVLDDPGRLVRGVFADQLCRPVLGVALLLAADAVDPLVASRRREPATRVRGHALGRPLLQRDHEGLAGRLLGDVDVTESAYQRGHDPAVLLAEDPLDLWSCVDHVA